MQYLQEPCRGIFFLFSLPRPSSFQMDVLPCIGISCFQAHTLFADYNYQGLLWLFARIDNTQSSDDNNETTDYQMPFPTQLGYSSQCN